MFWVCVTGRYLKRLFTVQLDKLLSFTEREKIERMSLRIAIGDEFRILGGCRICKSRTPGEK